MNRVTFNKTYKSHLKSEYNQGDFLSPGENGVCRGMCVEWIRHIVTTGHKHFDEMGLFEGLSQEKILRKFNKRFEKIKATHATLIDAKNLAGDKRKQAYSDLRDQQEELRKEQRKQPLDERQQKIDELVTQSNELGARILDNSSAGMRELMRLGFEELPELWKNEQGTKANGKARKSNFDQVVITGPDELREDLNNPKYMTGHAVSDKVCELLGRVPPASCVLLDVLGSTRDNKGHALAFYRTSLSKKVRFLDPNLGEYVFPSERGPFAQFLKDLWGCTLNDSDPSSSYDAAQFRYAWVTRFSTA